MEKMNNIRKNDYRYERKIVLQNNLSNEYNKFLNLINQKFIKAYPKRKINNIYFDDSNYSFLFANLDGLSERRKIRLRWYGRSLGKINANLEIKIKKGNVGYKETLKNIEFTLDQNYLIKEIMKNIFDSNEYNSFLEKIKNLEPVLLNNYNREYFESIDRNIRITLDTNIASKRIFNLSKLDRLKKNISSKIVIELKYKNSLDLNEIRELNNFQYRITKNSKYVSGILNSYF